MAPFEPDEPEGDEPCAVAVDVAEEPVAVEGGATEARLLTRDQVAAALVVSSPSV